MSAQNISKMPETSLDNEICDLNLGDKLVLNEESDNKSFASIAKQTGSLLKPNLPVQGSLLKTSLPAQGSLISQRAVKKQPSATTSEISISIPGTGVATNASTAQTTCASLAAQAGTRLFPTRDTWVMSYHLNSSTSYRPSDFIKILTVANLKEFWGLHNNLDKVHMLKDNNYYLFRQGITPTREDVKNRNGSIISIQFPDEIMIPAWTCLAGCVIGETFAQTKGSINGLAIKYIRENKKSRKAIYNGSFALIKIWVRALSAEIKESLRRFLKEVIPKYVNPKYVNFDYSIQISNIKPEY